MNASDASSVHPFSPSLTDTFRSLEIRAPYPQVRSSAKLRPLAEYDEDKDDDDLWDLYPILLERPVSSHENDGIDDRDAQPLDASASATNEEQYFNVAAAQQEQKVKDKRDRIKAWAEDVFSHSDHKSSGVLKSADCSAGLLGHPDRSDRPLWHRCSLLSPLSPKRRVSDDADQDLLRAPKLKCAEWTVPSRQTGTPKQPSLRARAYSSTQ